MREKSPEGLNGPKLDTIPNTYDESFDIYRLSHTETDDGLDQISPMEKFSYVYSELRPFRDSSLTSREFINGDILKLNFPKLALPDVQLEEGDGSAYLSMSLIMNPQGSVQIIGRCLEFDDSSKPTNGRYEDGSISVDRNWCANTAIYRKHGEAVDNALNHMMITIEDYMHLLTMGRDEQPPLERRRHSVVSEDDEIKKAVGDLISGQL